MDYLSNIRDKLLAPVSIEEEKSKFISKTTTKDELTGLYLRDVFDVVLRQKIEEAKRNNIQLSLLMMDIDDFKIVNDSYGHQLGDNVLLIFTDFFNMFFYYKLSMLTSIR
ncbi:Diguanylate cyclase, predicted domain protein [Candidatus Magnetomorum sp. HK-1]|nr:Diguanylate cyclase, predicted domain protein [Candidatus Magnetomorum sp. HK-1]